MADARGAARPRGSGGSLARARRAACKAGRVMRGVVLAGLLVGVLGGVLGGCDELVPRDTSSLFIPHLQRSEIVGLLAGFGTTFAALPDLIGMLRRRSGTGMNPRMAGIMGVFQVLWAYYGVLIASRPVIVWNGIAIGVNALSVAAYVHFVRRDKGGHEGGS